VFVDSLAENTNSDIGPHQRYAEGLLFDNIRGGEMNVQNRADSGSGHGWAGAQTVFWNCDATTMICDAPAAAMNFSIGNIAIQEEGFWVPSEPEGIWESQGTPVTPRSLYYRQLEDRLGALAVATVTAPNQQTGTIWSDLSAWKGDSDAPGLPVFYPVRANAGTDAGVVGDSYDLAATVRYPLPDEFAITKNWTQVSGQYDAMLSNPSSLSTTVTFPAPGIYEFQFTASQADARDPQNVITYNDSDTVVVTVTGAAFATLNASSIDIMIFCFTKTTVWGEWLAIKEKLAFEIKDIVEDEGAGFAFPSTSIYVESLPDDRPEAFSPPEERGEKEPKAKG
jgi:hypothetical protein